MCCVQMVTALSYLCTKSYIQAITTATLTSRRIEDIHKETLKIDVVVTFSSPSQITANAMQQPTAYSAQYGRERWLSSVNLVCNIKRYLSCATWNEDFALNYMLHITYAVVYTRLRRMRSIRCMFCAYAKTCNRGYLYGNTELNELKCTHFTYW